MIKQSDANDNARLYQIANPILDNPSVPMVNLVNDIIPHVNHYTPNAIMHRNEHGLLHCTYNWAATTNYCIAKGISVLSFDFGYFDHYKHFMVDYYMDKCISSIYKEWTNGSISDQLDWNTILPSIQQHRETVLAKHDRAKNSDPIPCLKGKRYVVIWAQWTTDLIKHRFYEHDRPINMKHWFTKLIDQIQQAGLTPVIKMSPVKVTNTYDQLDERAFYFVGRKKHVIDVPGALFVRDANARLIAHAQQHIICCSSVSNELVLTGAKVTAMGRSWFDNLGIFHEPKTWDQVTDYQPPNPLNVNKWINWWASRQCLKDDICDKIAEVYERSRT